MPGEGKNTSGRAALCPTNLYNRHPPSSPPRLLPGFSFPRSYYTELPHRLRASIFFFLFPRVAGKRKRRRGRDCKVGSPDLEEAARQLLFLHSSKSSLESNLPVCYCIQTTPQPVSRYPFPPRLFYGRCRSVSASLRASERKRSLARSRARVHTVKVVREPFLFVSSFRSASKHTDFACTRVASLFSDF